MLATSESDGQGHTNVLGGDENLRLAGARAGASNLPGERAGVLRRFTYSMSRLPTLAVVVAERRGLHVAPSAFPHGGAYIDFRGPAGTVPTVSLSALVNGRIIAFGPPAEVMTPERLRQTYGGRLTYLDRVALPGVVRP